MALPCDKGKEGSAFRTFLAQRGFEPDEKFALGICGSRSVVGSPGIKPEAAHLTGEATTDNLPSGTAKFKMSLARPQQTTPFAALRACHPASESLKSMPCGLLTGEATMDKLPSGPQSSK